ncbi:tetratricopeptide repeat protein [Psychrobacter glacincola]|uniref:tetratricopeptide repeat protein n=1 Tax=Psychrobacter glacincola TaxID=56810 RepID=UPI003FCF443D
MESVNLLNELFEKKQYVKFIEKFESYSKESIDIENNEDLKKQAAISYFKNKEFGKTLSYIESIKNKTLDGDYLLCELYAECLLQDHKLDQSYSYYNKALSINPKLRSARVKYFVLGQRMGYRFDEQELNWCIESAYKSKTMSWLRELGHISYTNRIFDKANLCFSSIVGLGGKLTYIDNISYTTQGDITSRNSNAELVDSSSDELFMRQIKTVKDSKKLVVTFAPGNKYVLRSYAFGCTVLSVADLTNSYYLYSCNRLAEYIKNLVINKGYSEIALVGGSKGGTGAMLVYNILSKVIDIKIKCTVFSPQIKLFPFNDNLKIPSYHQLATIYSINPMARYIISKIQLPNELVAREGDEVTVFYGNNYTMDRIEAENLKESSGVRKIELEYSAHSTTIPLTIPDGKTIEDLRESYKDLHTINDVDFQYLGGGKTIDIIDEIWNIYSDHKMRLRNFI